MKIESVDSESKRISLAPTDYESTDDVEEKERKEYKAFKDSTKKRKESQPALGSLGELLKARMEEKKK